MSPSLLPKRIVLFSWGSVALFYLYQYILRVLPGVIVPELRQTFGITAEEFSTLGAFYLYAYALLQIPAGLIIDRIGVRKTVLVSILLCILGNTLLGLTHHFGVAQASRIAVGAGSACAFMGCLKVVADHMPPGKRGFLMGASLTLGTLGAISAGAPLTSLIAKTDWRTALLLISGLGLMVWFGCVAFLAPESRRTIQHSRSSMWKGTFSVLRNRSIWVYAILAIGLYTPLSVLADLWGVSLLMQKYSLHRDRAAQICMTMYAGLCVGSLSMPWLCERYNILNRAIRISTFLLISVFAFLLYGPALSDTQLVILLFILGILCGTEMLCFTGACAQVEPEKSGITIGVTNTANMLGGALLQQGVGLFLDWKWRGSIDDNGIRLYSAQEYTASMSLLLIVLAICCITALALPADKKPNVLYSP